MVRLGRRGGAVALATLAATLLALAPQGRRGAGPARAFGTNVRLQVKPDRREEFLQSIQACQKATLEEPLAVEFVFGSDEADPNTFHVHEHYDGKKGYEEHSKTAHCKDWEAFLATDPLEGPAERHSFLVRRLPNSEWSRSISWEPRLCINKEMHVNPDMREKFLECIERLQVATLEQEMKSLEYLVGEDEEIPNTFHIHEQYIGKEGLEAHEKEDHSEEWEEILELTLKDKPKAVHYMDASFTEQK